MTLKDGGLVAGAVSTLHNTSLDGSTVTVAVYRSEKLLCVAHLPLTMTEDGFRALLSQHGDVDMCFLMRDEHSGKALQTK